MPPIRPLPASAPLAAFRAQADALFAAWQHGDTDAIALVRRRHPKFLDPRISWLPRRMSEAEVRATPFDRGDALLALARWYDFADWASLAAHVAAVAADPEVAAFEAAVDALVAGDLPRLGLLLARHPGLAAARSTRVTPFDPPRHRATLLHYVAANGVEGYRQTTPANAVAVARALLIAGADPDALADMYGGKAAVMPMLVSSTPPAAAGVQVALVDVLADFGASVEAVGNGKWASPLMTALAFGFGDAARALVRRGARIDRLAAAAGLGDAQRAAELLRAADAGERQRALSLAVVHGYAAIVAALLEAGAEVDRYNPEGNHPHSTPLHQAVWSGREDIVRLLVARGARLDMRDTIYDGTPLDWAVHGGKTAIANYLRGLGG